MSDFKKIAVLCGGPSPEYDISLGSADTVLTNLDDRRFKAEKIIVGRDGSFPVKPEKFKSRFDVVFLAMHGPFGEDGTIQEILEGVGLPYTGSQVAASRLGMDKIASKKLFAQNDISTPRFKLLNSAAELADASRLIGFPLVIKPSNQGSSVGVTIVRDSQDFEKAFKTAARFGPVIAEEFIEGRELTVGILIDRALPVVEIKPRREFFDYLAKYEEGLAEEIVPAQIGDRATQRACQSALAAFELLGCRGFARVDMFLRSDGEILVTEVNTIPGLTESSLFPKEVKAQGIALSDAFVAIINEALNDS